MPTRQRGDAQLGSGKVDEDPTWPVGQAAGLAHAASKLTPGHLVIVCGVDARHVHALGDQAPHEIAAQGGLTRQRDHDPREAPGRLRPEERDRPLGEEATLGRPQPAQALDAARFGRLAEEGIEGQAHGRDAHPHVRFQATERGQAERRQLVLRVPHVVTAEGQVGGQVRRTERVVRADDALVPTLHAFALAPANVRIEGGQALPKVTQAGADCRGIHRTITPPDAVSTSDGSPTDRLADAWSPR